MSLVAGIDFSSHAVDVVWLDEDTDQATWERFPLSGQDAFERTRSVRPSLVSVRGTSEKWIETLAIGIEEPRGYNSGALYRVQGAILACLPRAVLVQPWLPSVWRKAVGLPGNASKGEVWSYVVAETEERWRDNARRDWPQDACDAYCIALATRNALQREEAA